MKYFLVFLTLLAGASCVSATRAADVGLTADTSDRYCMTCHGVDGIGNVGIQAPRLAGMEPWYLQRQLENFRAGIRGTHPEDEQGLAMQPMAATLTDTSIADIISWVQSWEYVAAETTVSGDSDRGRTAYQSCAACHGADARGNEALGAPALAGQNDWYLVTQLKNFRAGYRGTHKNDRYGSQMLPMARLLADEQAIVDVASYINTLRSRNQ